VEEGPEGGRDSVRLREFASKLLQIDNLSIQSFFEIINRIDFCAQTKDNFGLLARNTNMTHELFTVCKDCIFHAAYPVLVLIIFGVSALISRANSVEASRVEGGRGREPPMLGGELHNPATRKAPEMSELAEKAASVLNSLASFSLFLQIVDVAREFIRTIFFMRDNPTPLRSFRRYLNFYYLIIVLPAAFMPPVSHPQRPPDFQLLAAVILLICVNALGDVISVRIFLRIFPRFEPSKYELWKKMQADPWVGLRGEIGYYLAVIIGGLCCLVVLIVVLMCSSVLYGVQIGQMDFGLTQSFFHNAWDRIVRFTELPRTLYWFRGQPGPFGTAGVPGLFLYGLTTFLPMIILACLALFWLLLIPFRLAVSLPPTTPPWARVVSAQLALLGMCIITGLVLDRI
jgi:hypothetical protein